MAYQPNLLEVRFHGTEQKLGPRHILLPGKLVQARDVYQTKSKTYRKREGYSVVNTNATADYTDAGTTNAAVGSCYGLATAGGLLVQRSAGAAYTYDVANSKLLFRGETHRVGVSSSLTLANAGRIPVMALDTSRNKAWSFGVGLDGKVWFSVYDLTRGELTTPPSQLTGISASTTNQLRAFYDTTNDRVWLLRFTTSNTIVSHNLDPTSDYLYASGSTVGAGTSIFAPSAGTLYGFDAAPIGNSNCAAVLCYGSALGFGAGLNGSWIALLDSGTGSYNAGVGRIAVGAALTRIATLVKTGLATNIYVVAGETGWAWQTYKLHPTTLATVSTETSWSPGTSSPTSHKLSVVAWLSGSELHFIASRAEPTNNEDMILGHVSTQFGGATVDDNWMRASWVASEVFTVGSHQYVITGHDDGARYQCAYYVRRLTRPSGSLPASVPEKTIVARLLHARGGQLHYQPASSGSYQQLTQGLAQVFVSSNTARVCLQQWTEGDQYGASLVEVDTAATMGPLVVDGESVVFPGAWPQRYSGGRLVEMAPMMAPRSISLSSTGAGVPAGTYSVAACYRLRTPDGLVYRSAPAQSTITLGGGASIRVTYPTLRFANQHPYSAIPGTTTAVKVDVEIYCTSTDGSLLKLVATRPNDETVDSATYDIAAVPTTVDEALYTTGGALENAPPPPFRAAFLWRRRLWLVDTDVEGDVWYSQEAETGFGRRFNELLTFSLGENGGRVRAGGAVDDNYAALFRKGEIWVVAGAGPDPLGVGGYEPVRLPNELGCENPASLVTAPMGLFFQAPDGGVYLLGRDLQVVYVGRGIDDAKSLTVVSAVHVAIKQHVRFHMSDGKVYVFDYGNPTAEEPLGQWYEWTGQTAAVGSVVFGDVHYYVTSAGLMYKQVTSQFYDGTSTPILPKLKLAKLRPAGLRGRFVPWHLQLIGDYVSSHDLRVTVGYNDSDVTQTFNRSVSTGPEAFEMKLHAGDMVTDLEVTIEQTGSATTEGFTLDGLMLEYGPAPGLKRGVTRMST